MAAETLLPAAVRLCSFSHPTPPFSNHAALTAELFQNIPHGNKVPVSLGSNQTDQPGAEKEISALRLVNTDLSEGLK